MIFNCFKSKHRGPYKVPGKGTTNKTRTLEFTKSVKKHDVLLALTREIKPLTA